MAEAKINLEINRIGKVKYMVGGGTLRLFCRVWPLSQSWVCHALDYPSGELGSAVVRCWTTALGVAGLNPSEMDPN